MDAFNVQVDRQSWRRGYILLRRLVRKLLDYGNINDFTIVIVR